MNETNEPTKNWHDYLEKNADGRYLANRMRFTICSHFNTHPEKIPTELLIGIIECVNEKNQDFLQTTKRLQENIILYQNENEALKKRVDTMEEELNEMEKDKEYWEEKAKGYYDML